jgi:hypothetical protein
MAPRLLTVAVASGRLATKALIPTVNLGVKSIAVDDRRQHRDRTSFSRC